MNSETGKNRFRPKPRRASWGLLHRREVLLPTRRGWLLFLLSGILLATMAIRSVHPFLAVNRPIPAGVLVVEGWAPDYILKAAIAQFHAQDYTRLYVTGVPLQEGTPFSEYKSFAELGKARLILLGLNKEVVTAVPAPKVRQDRTYASAVALGKFLRQQNPRPASLNVMTEGPHARRSRLLFEKALGQGIQVGIIAVAPQEYDPNRWWRFSSGVRGVIGEIVGYVYARFFFWSSPERTE